MRIDPKGTIAGQPAMKIRDFLRQFTGGNVCTVSLAAELLHISPQKARSVISKLVALKYIELTQVNEKKCYWQNTVKGNAFSLATAAKPVSRETAQRVIDEFVERCRKVNADAYYLYRVKRAVVFGSFLTDAQQLNDVDLAIELEPREIDPKRHTEMCWKRTRAAMDAGRNFSNLTAQLFWAQREVTLFLKARSTAISLHLDDPIVKQVNTRIIFEER